MIPTCQYILDMKDEWSMLYLSWNFKISMLKGCDNWVCTVEKMMGWVGYVGDLKSVNSICKFILDWKCNLYYFFDADSKCNLKKMKLIVGAKPLSCIEVQ